MTSEQVVCLAGALEDEGVDITLGQLKRACSKVFDVKPTAPLYKNWGFSVEQGL